MASYASWRAGRALQVHVIRVYSLSDALPPVSRFAVLALDSGAAMAAVITGLGLCDVAEVTDEILDPAIVETLDLKPNRPVRLV